MYWQVLENDDFIFVVVRLPVSLSTMSRERHAIFSVRYDSRVKAMEVDERPTEQYGDIGGLDKQIQEVCLTT